MTNSQKFVGWRSNRRLSELEAFYGAVSADPESVSDADFVQNITNAFWPTNCWAFVEQAFAIIAPGCAIRPHLIRELIVHPIEAMIYGVLVDENDVIAQGVAFASKAHPYVEPTPEDGAGCSSSGQLWKLLLSKSFAKSITRRPVEI